METPARSEQWPFKYRYIKDPCKVVLLNRLNFIPHLRMGPIPTSIWHEEYRSCCMASLIQNQTLVAFFQISGSITQSQEQSFAFVFLECNNIRFQFFFHELDMQYEVYSILIQKYINQYKRFFLWENPSSFKKKMKPSQHWLDSLFKPSAYL